jgi:hypothetical protein
MTDPVGPGGNERYSGSQVKGPGYPHGYRAGPCVRAAEAPHLDVHELCVGNSKWLK